LIECFSFDSKKLLFFIFAATFLYQVSAFLIIFHLILYRFLIFIIFCLEHLAKFFCYYPILIQIFMLNFHFLLKIHCKATDSKVLSKLYSNSLMIILLHSADYFHLAFKCFIKKKINSNSVNSIIYHFLNCLR